MYITLFLVHFNGSEVIRSQSFKCQKSYQINQVTSIKKLLGVSNIILAQKSKLITVSLGSAFSSKFLTVFHFIMK